MLALAAASSRYTLNVECTGPSCSQEQGQGRLQPGVIFNGVHSVCTVSISVPREVELTKA